MNDTRDIETRTEGRHSSRQDGRELLAYLHGELDARAVDALRRRLESDPALARRLDSLRETWDALELPPVAPAPPGFAARVAARASEEMAAGEGAGAFRPAWVRLAGAAVLAGGIAAGAGLGLLVTPHGEQAPALSTATTVDDLTSTTGSTLAEAYWSTFEDATGEGEELR